ncbi:MAG TPA: type II secretion system protein GspG [Gemmataceae bacterium]|nr:type II secretion system protein GspG [Gemmataceae bacterium]
MIKRPAQAATRAAFTLMEMLVVVAILVVLAGAAVPIYLSYLDNARKDRAKLDIKTLEGMVMAYEARHGYLPQNGWNDLLTPEDDVRAVLEPNSLIDPWGRQYVLDTNTVHPTSRKPRIMSQGPPGGQPISNF